MVVETPTAPAWQGRKLPLLVLVEGNICAGKSSLCKELSEALGMDVAIEPTTKNPFLDLYYSDP